jgi:hypothetical protein
MEVAMKKFTLSVVLIAVPLFFFGCAVANVKYRATDDINKSYIPIALMASRVTIAMPDQAIPINLTKPGEQAKPGGSADQKQDATTININPQKVTIKELREKAVIVVTPTQAEGSLRYLEPQDDLFKSTNLSITYFDGLKVPKTVGVVVEDRSVKMISAIGGFVAAVAAMAAPPSGPPQEPDIYLPILLDFSKPGVFGNNEREICKQLDGKNFTYGVCYKLIPREGREKNEKKEMYTYTEFFKLYENNFTSNLVFSRCADIEGKIVNWQTKDALSVFATTIADPYHVDWLPLPIKGSITAQGVCGANSSTEKSENPGGPEVIEALTKQVNSVWQALHPAKEKPTN